MNLKGGLSKKLFRRLRIHLGALQHFGLLRRHVLLVWTADSRSVGLYKTRMHIGPVVAPVYGAVKAPSGCLVI